MIARSASTIFLAVLLVACGGGGREPATGGYPAPDQGSAPQESPVPDPPPPSPDGANGGDAGGAPGEVRQFSLATIDIISDNVPPSTGAVDNGGATNDLTPTLLGGLSAPLAADQVLRVFRNEIDVGTAEVDGSTWVFTDGPLEPGYFAYTARVVSATGDQGPASPTYGITYAPVRYRILDLGVLSEAVALWGEDVPNVLAASINDAGDVVGVTSHLWDIPFIWRENEGMVSLIGGTGAGYASAISNRDATTASGPHVAWWVNGRSVRFPPRAAIWEEGAGSQEIGALPGGLFSASTGVNRRGQVVGWSHTGVDQRRAFIWYPLAGMVDLGTLPGSSSSWAEGINDSTLVVGYSAFPSGETRGFVWTPGDGLSEIAPLVGDASSRAISVNNNAAVAGVSGALGTRRPFVWRQPQGAVALDRLPGSSECVPMRIDDLGIVFGSCRWLGNEERASLWLDGRPFDLNEMISASDPLKATARISGAVGADAKGRIAGNAHILPDYHARAVLLVPE